MTRHRGALRCAFTLIEVLVAMALAMLLMGMSLEAFFQIRQLVKRTEARMAMYQSAQVIYTKLYQSLGAAMQHCAFVVLSDANGIQLIYMRGKEDVGDWRLWERTRINTDLVWEGWRWSKLTAILSQGSSRPQRSFSYRGQAYDALPQPRRFLDPVDPLSTLDDNRYFPHAVTAVPGDYGDYSDLTDQLVPVLGQVSDLTIQIVAQDGTIDTVSTAAPAAPVTLVRQGVWMDGRVGPALSATPTAAMYATSEIAKRPKIVRVLFTLTDSATDPRADLTQTFSFSFALPGLAAAP